MKNDTNTILLGHKEIKAKYQDGSKGEIQVKIVSHLKSEELANCFDDALALLELTTGLKEPELEKLTAETYFTLIDTAREVNAHILELLVKSDQKKMLLPEYQELLKVSISLASAGLATQSQNSETQE